MDRNLTKAVILGHTIADATGVPVEFMRRATLAKAPATEYLGYGIYAFILTALRDTQSKEGIPEA